MADNDLVSILTTVLRQAPQWIRADLSSKDAALRERAEDALAAMLAAAVAAADELIFSDPPRH